MAKNDDFQIFRKSQNRGLQSGIFEVLKSHKNRRLKSTKMDKNGLKIDFLTRAKK